MRWLSATFNAYVPFLSGTEGYLTRTQICIFVYSILVIYFNKYFKQAAGGIVTKENHKYKKDHEESTIQKSYTLGFFNSYLGMGAAAFFDQRLANVCGLLLNVLMLKQIIMNLIDLITPKCTIPKKYKAHHLGMIKHYEKHAEEYSTIEDKNEHYEAEKQTLMGDMPPMMVPLYNELVI